jgi:signal transduction histidine kinase/ActR/RegA family two-component response regulator
VLRGEGKKSTGTMGTLSLAKTRWERELEALRKLSRVLAEEARGGHLEEALEAVLAALELDAGATFSVDGTFLNLVGERGVLSGADGRDPKRDLLREALVVVATRAAAARKAVHFADLTRAELDAEQRTELVRNGFAALVAQPVKHQREVLGVLILLAKDATALDSSGLGFLETSSHMVALAAERDRRAEREHGYRAELIEAGHMAALGLLTATVAHELRGPVGALAVQLAEQQQMVDQLREAGPETSPLFSEMTELLLDMKAASAQMSTLIAQLSSLSRRETTPDKLELSAVARDGLAIARSALKRRGITLVEDYAPSCACMGRRDNLVQVILNLVFNAADACAVANRAEPTITVRTRSEASRVIISVDDNGPGVPPNDIHAIFQPFFTTKERGRGTGLGLKICSDVVTAHHGHIEVVNLESGGASFRVILPKLPGAGPSLNPREMTTLPPTSERMEIRQVLVVDDDELFTRTMRRALKPHNVRTASTASEAEMVLLDPGYTPHLVLCDLGLPGMTGDVLHARIFEKRPMVAEHFVFVTGGACSKREADYLRSSGCPTLLKPVDIKDVWAALAAPHPRESQTPEALATLRSEAPESERTSGIPTQPRG